MANQILAMALFLTSLTSLADTPRFSMELPARPDAPILSAAPILIRNAFYA